MTSHSLLDWTKARKRSLYLVIDGGQMRPKRREIRYARGFYVKYGKIVKSAKMLTVPLVGVGTVLRLERDAWSMVT